MTGDNVIPIRRPIRWQALRSDEAERVVREIVRDTSKVIFTDHAFDRVELRSITVADALVILRTGHVEGEPVKDGDHWKVVVVKRMAGSREAGVVTVIIGEGERLVVPTVEWMDTKR